MIKKPDRRESRLARHKRVRAKISGTEQRPRLNVFRSSKHIYAQIIDDLSGNTIVSSSTLEKEFSGFGGNKEAARKIGEQIAKKAIEKGISTVVFDKGGFIYHGRVQELAEGARNGGLKF